MRARLRVQAETSGPVEWYHIRHPDIETKTGVELGYQLLP
jgi:hypothetical protein